MPAVEFDYRERQRKALLWMRTGYDLYGQAVTASQPVEIQVRWNASNKKVMDKNGNLIQLDAEVVVGQDVLIDSKMWLAPFGTKSALSVWMGTGSALPDDQLMEVKVYEDMFDVKGRVKRRELGLMRFRQTTATGQG